MRFLFEQRQIAAIGHETLDTDAAVDFRRNKGLIGEFYMLDHDAWQVEVMNNLDKVPAVEVYIQVSFPNFADTPGFPVRACLFA
ncbi:MAG: hypothetical protein ACSLEN_03030 [Candidatus Malihini olakiniferum]